MFATRPRGKPALLRHSPLRSSPLVPHYDHNGNLVNVDELKRTTFEKEGRVSITNSDSRSSSMSLPLSFFAEPGHAPPKRTCFARFVRYTVPARALCGHRDSKHRHRRLPRYLGYRPSPMTPVTEKGTELIIASESVALDILNAGKKATSRP